jgi:hypothetical protein
MNSVPEDRDVKSAPPGRARLAARLMISVPLAAGPQDWRGATAMTDPELPAGYRPSAGTPLVTQADRWAWQRRAARALAGNLDAHPDLPQITWTVGPTGSLSGHVNGLAPAEQVRATFTAWQRALRLESVSEVPIRDTGVISLSGQVYCGTVRVALLARVYDPLPEDEEPAATPAQGPAPRPDDHVHHAPGGRPRAVGQRGSGPEARPGRSQAGPLISPRSPDGPHATPHL